MYLTLLSVFAAFALPQAQDAKRNEFPDVHPIPPLGVEVSAGDRQELEAGIQALGGEIESLRTSLKGKPALLDLLPDVQIFHNAARYALTYNEFFNAGEIGTAKTLLQHGMERARQLREGQAPWTTATGLVVRGYVSKIDGSVQPYGLVVPASYAPNNATKHRLDIWFHGRGETLSEVNFLNDREHNRGEFTPPDTFVLHPYGRFCNANRFAGEVDTVEALESVKKQYPIDPNRIAVRGFSMGGASCWQFGTHYPGEWVACAPGAGFSETAEFLNLAKSGEKTPWYQQKLWRMYDSVDYALNLANLPTVAYSGENDGQKQAADRMTDALAKENIALVHVIGPKAGHWYAPSAKPEINRRIDSIAAQGRDAIPAAIHFSTYTLRYNRADWLMLDGLAQHWERARVDAELDANSGIRAKTQNVTALSFAFEPGQCPLDLTRRSVVILDGQKLAVPAPLSDRSWMAHFRKVGTKWAVAERTNNETLQKRHGLQGPIDDAFMDSFVMVTPTGRPINDQLGAWITSEQEHAITHWRRQFRGEARVKNDAEITDADIANSNLVLWGDPQSNRVLARIADRLPIQWTSTGVRVGTQTYDAAHSVPVLVFPNPLNPEHYVVLNSGFTFREFDYLNNARQTPKLPDWAVIDTNTPRTARTPGTVLDAGFFDERWQLENSASAHGERRTASARSAR